MTELTDAEVMAPPEHELSDAEVSLPPEAARAPVARMDEALRYQVPKAFMDRVERGAQIDRVLARATAGLKEGFGEGTPTGLSDEMLQGFIDTGLFHDPMKGRPGPVQLLTESVTLPTAKAIDTIMRAVNAGIHGVGGVIGQIVEERGASQGEAARAEREAINFGNWAMIEAGFGRFARTKVASRETPQEQVIGTLPAEADFKTSAKILGGEATEANLRRKWQEDGVHPAEAVHDAQADAFLKRELTRPETDPAVKLPPEAWAPENLAQFGEAPALVVARKMPDGSIKYGKPGEVHVDLMSKKELSSEGATPPEIEASMGYALPGGEFMTRKEALDFAARNEPARAAYSLQQPEFGLEASYYQEPYKLPKEAEGAPLRAVGAEATRDMPTLAEQPPPPPGRLVASVQEGVDTLFDMGRDLQMMVAPMATGTTESMALAKDFANTLRRNRWEWARIDDDVAKRFNPEQRKRMWDAADEESVARQLGESREHQGLITLEPEERAAVEAMQARAQLAWVRARDLGMVEGEGLPAYTPRMLMNVAVGSDRGGSIPLNGIGLNLRTQTGSMKRRMYLTAEETEAAAKRLVGMREAKNLSTLEEINEAVDAVRIARDIRALPLATGKLEDAIAGRTLINSIKDYGKRAGIDTVAEGGKPAGSDQAWFTLDHPAFRTWRPKLKEEGGKFEVVKDKDGNTIFEQIPIYVNGDFEGPLRAVLTQRSGPLYGAAMALKGKTMSLIMNSPLIHNAVEWGRALFAMPGKVATFKVYFEGNAAKNNVGLMREAIDAGLVPIGKRFFNQDITSVMESPDLTPGRSWTAKVLGFVPGLFDEAAGTAVKAAIDKAGDFWHNTLLWDRVADLQMGLYTNFRTDLMAKGVDQTTASRAAAHFANRYAGALPQEAMSDGARKFANMLLFSRSFTLGNIGVMKDMLNGLPRDVMAQISRDVGSLDPNAAGYIRSIARRKAVAVVMLDMAGMYVLNSLFQNASSIMLGDSTLDKEMHGYAERLSHALTETKEHPLKLLQPLNFFHEMSATSENEPGRQERIKVGYAKDGTAIYGRSPVGKIGEEFSGYMTGPLDMLRRKLGTVARPAWQILANDAGFGRKVYDPNADVPEKYLKNMGLIVAHLVKSQFPEGQLSAAADLVKGEGDPKVNLLQAVGPIAGVTFSKGAPGGPAVGELYQARSQHQYAIDAALPDIRRQIQRGDLPGATERMNELGIPPGLQRFYVRTSVNPATRLSGRSLRDFYLYATPEQRARMENAR